MKYEKRTNKCFDESDCGISPSKVEDPIDERLILKMDEEAPEHVFPEPKTKIGKSNILRSVKKHKKYQSFFVSISA